MSVAVLAAAAPPGARGASDIAAPARSGDTGGRYPELDCVRHLFPASVLAAAEMRAERLGIGADRALIATGAIDEENYARALAASLGTAFEPLDSAIRVQCPLGDARLIEGAATGLLPLHSQDGMSLVLAPRGIAARRIVQLAADTPDWPKRFRFTSTDRLLSFVLANARTALIARACHRLKDEMPAFSAATQGKGRALALVLLALVGAATASTAVITAIDAALAVLFLAWLGLRLIGAMAARPRPTPLAFTADAELPIYTVIVALYREASSVDGLLRAIAALDYPREKLDVIIAVEADDAGTRAALARCGPRLPLTVIPVPVAAPRTKPKALNVALPFARGAFTVIYDAEDRPEPDQLRRALQAFRIHGDDLACVQARLCIDNTADSWLTRLFTAEYAAQFDVFLDGLSRFRLPLPLGGSSNHFYTDVLRKVGAWDPYNVTEDADLGMRLARLGYRALMIDSTTYEEAPARFGPWLRQRTRWFKGWMQTWCVHMREPRRLLRDLGPTGFLAFQLVVGGNVLAALVHPLFLAGLAVVLTQGQPAIDDGGAMSFLTVLYGINALVGYLTSALLGWLGLRRRGLLSTAWVLLLTPLNWLLLSLAAWRAFGQFVVAPYRWEKTEHGLAKSSRRADAALRSLTALESQLRDLGEAGGLPSPSEDAGWRATPKLAVHPLRARGRMRLTGRGRLAAGAPSSAQSSPSEYPNMTIVNSN